MDRNVTRVLGPLFGRPTHWWERRDYTTMAAAAMGLVASVVLALVAILPLSRALLLAGAALWFVSPGVVAMRCLYPTPRSYGALLMAPAWGYFLSSLALLALWFVGIRSTWSLLAGPLVAWPVAWLCGACARRRLRLPSFDRQDAMAVCLVLLLVPLVVARPYARVGEDSVDGKSYRAYFTADFVWAMAVVSEVSKGDTIPQNPYLRGDDLHYYWLTHLFPAIEHRALRQVPLEKILLVNAVFSGLAFVSFLYFFTRHFIHRADAAAAACVCAVLFTSFEGVHELVNLWRAGAPPDLVRYLNIDAVTRWIYHSMPVDGLQRLLLYQPQHQIGYELAFSALVLLEESVEFADTRALFLVGTLLGGGFLASTFAAIMVGTAATLHHAVRIAVERRWQVLGSSLLAAGVPVGGAVALALTLGYVDADRSLVTFGVNPVAATKWAVALLLSFGPITFGVVVGLWWTVRNGDSWRMLMPVVVIAVSMAFYFFVDVIDHQDVYVGWRAGHLTFIAAAPLCGYVFQELQRRRGAIRTAGVAVAAALCLLAAPTTAIDLYNSQDTSNRQPNPSGHWTLVLSPDEIEALAWIRRATPSDARVQVEPTVRDPETWAYIPAFGERRMAAGLPISMVPLAQYQAASNRIRRVYRSQTMDDLYSDALRQGIDYLVVAPIERTAYPQLEPLLESDPEHFSPVFHNASVRIYHVNPLRHHS